MKSFLTPNTTSIETEPKKNRNKLLVEAQIVASDHSEVKRFEDFEEIIEESFKKTKTKKIQD